MRVAPPTQQFPDRIDGVVSENEGIREAAFVPEGILIHEYLPLEYILIKEIGNDLMYLTTYWDVDRYWQTYIQDRNVYERLRDQLLLSRPVVVDYTDYSKLGIYIPINKHIEGLNELYKTMLEDLRELDREDLDRILKEKGYAEIEQTIKSYKDKTDL